jgi:hypothetical protein
MIDIVTVVFQDELAVLRQQACSLDLYCQNIGIKSILVIVNDTDAVARDIDTAWWGKLQHLVRIVPASTFSTELYTTGWVSQQALKMMASAVSYNTWSMVLDAKTIFVRELELHSLFDHQGRPQVGQLDIYPVFAPSQAIVNDFFKIDLQQQIGPGGVPFFVHNHTARAMIVEIENQSHQSFADWFQSHGRLTEFILYSGFVQHQHGNFDQLYNVKNRAVAVCNVCHSEVASFDRKFAEMPHSMTVSIHREAWRQLDHTRQQQYQEFLSARGIK